MKTETLPKEKQQKNGLLGAILALKPGECLRLTTAREGRNIAGLSTSLKRLSAGKIHTRYDGDDVLAWIEKNAEAGKDRP